MHGPTGASGHTGTILVSGTSGSIGTLVTPETWGTGGMAWGGSTSGWALRPEEDKIITITITITNRDRMRRIKVKKEKAEPERTEVKSSTVFEMALRIARNSFYGILGGKVERTKTPEVSGRVKKIKWKQN